MTHEELILYLTILGDILDMRFRISNEKIAWGLVY